jgi:diguanylate cyclase (GGDEF)-like protein
MKSALSIIVLSISLAEVAAQTPTLIPVDPSGETKITDRSALWFDADPSIGIEEVSSPAFLSRFSPVEGRQVWVGKKAEAAWLQFALAAAAGDQSYFLEVRPSFSIILDHIDLYLPRIGGGFDHVAAGALEESRPGGPSSRFFLFALPKTVFSGSPIYLRVASSMDVELHLSIWESNALVREESLEYGAYGIIFGILLAMALYNFFLFISLRDKAYLLYVLYLINGAAWLFWVQGGARAVIGSHPALDQSLLWLFAGGMMAWGAAFSSAFLRLRRNRPILFALLMVSCGVSAAAAIAGFLGLYHVANLVTNVLGGALVLSLVFAAASRVVQSYEPALFFLFAWSFLMISGGAFVLMDLKVLPVSFWTMNSMAIGMAVEAILLSMALADRFKGTEREKAYLERNQERLRLASLTDALTGLYNRRSLDEELEIEVERAAAQQHDLSIILLDIDDFKAINDAWGHPFGDKVLKALATAIRSSIRESDRPCRLGGEEFVVIMPEANLEEAWHAAERIRERFAALSFHTPACTEVRATVSLGVVEFVTGETPASLIERVDRAMYRAKHRGKNQTVKA